MPRKKNAAKQKASSSGAPNKSAFVRGLPATMPAKDVVEKAKAQGMTLTVPYVYSIRTASKARTKKSASMTAPARRGRPPKSASPIGGSSGNTRVEDLLRAVAAELGLSHAIKLLQAEQQKVRAVFGG